MSRRKSTLAAEAKALAEAAAVEDAKLAEQLKTPQPPPRPTAADRIVMLSDLAREIKTRHRPALSDGLIGTIISTGLSYHVWAEQQDERFNPSQVMGQVESQPEGETLPIEVHETLPADVEAAPAEQE